MNLRERCATRPVGALRLSPLLVIAGLLVATAAPAAPCLATVINVPAGQPTLKAAIAVAADGDEIVVADGVYTGPDNRDLNFGGRNLFVHSANGASGCVLDGQMAGRVFRFISGEGPTSIVEGFTIRNGRVTTAPSRGGAIAIQGVAALTSPTIRNCVFENNSAGVGGAIAVWGTATPLIEACSFSANHAIAGIGGGGIYAEGTNSAPTVVGCTFTVNTTVDCGAGMIAASGSSPLVRECTFIGNSAPTFGGAIYNTGTSTPRFWNCRFFGNSAAWGGAVALVSNSSGSIVNGVFCGNASVTQAGGAVAFISAGGASLLNCTITGNSSPDGAGGGGVLSLSSGNVTIANSIVWGNFGGQIGVGGTPPTVSYSIVQDGFDGTGNSASDPLFVDVDGADDMLGTIDDDVRIGSGSPAIDSGSNPAWTVALSVDVANGPRFVDDPWTPDAGVGSAPIIDRGAFEFVPPRCVAADLNCDGTIDGADLGLLLGGWGSSDPALDLNGDGTVDGADLGVLLGAWNA